MGQKMRGNTAKAEKQPSRSRHGQRAVSVGALFQTSEHVLRVILENAPDYVVLLERDGRIVFANRFPEGWDPGAVLGKRGKDLVPRSYHNPIRLLIERVVLTRRAQVVEHPAVVGGVAKWFRSRVSPIVFRDEVIGVLVIATELTERKKVEENLRQAHRELTTRSDELEQTVTQLNRQIAEHAKIEAELRSSRTQLRALSRKLISIQEAERAQIAREVHDELGQAMTAIKLNLAWLGQRIQQSELHERIDNSLRLIDETILAIRRISSGLRPPVLDDLGLVAALEWQADEFERRTGISCHLEIVPEDIPVDHERAVAVFRIFQECLTNIARHAGASEVRASARCDGRRLVLEVRDNGRGITPDQIADRRSLGLIGIRERARLCGGRAHFRGTNGRGSIVRVTVPIGGDRR